MYNEGSSDKFYGIERGTVANNKDPRGLGRVRVYAPNFFSEDGSPWAYPVGGGGTKSGVWNVPAEGDPVFVLFRGGDPDYPVYMRASHIVGLRPEYVQRAIDESSGEDAVTVATEVRAFETRDWDVVIDERENRRLFRVRAKGIGSEDPDGTSLMIELDYERGILALSAPVGISLRSAGGNVDIQTLNPVAINGRAVVKGTRKGI